jgi:hypothetical protein
MKIQAVVYFADPGPEILILQQKKRAKNTIKGA